MINKELFYEQLKPFAHKSITIRLVIRFGEFYELLFTWERRIRSEEYAPMYAQLIDMRKSGSNKYVAPDLDFDPIKEGITTDYKLYKYLCKWVDNAMKEYERVEH